MMNVSAGADGNRWGEREFFRSYSIQRLVVERGDQRNDSQMQTQGERGRGREFGGQDSSGYGNQGGNSSNGANDNSRKQGRMTPEERRALRRQIDEAGHDIYPQKR
jgi:hypothetical protein